MLANAQDLILSEVVRAAGVFFGSEFIVSEVMISMMGGVEIQVGKAAILAEALIRATSESELLQILSGQSWTKEVVEGLRSMYGLCKFLYRVSYPLSTGSYNRMP